MIKLPKVNQNETLESTSITKLEDLIGHRLFEIRRRESRDKGVDLYIEVKENNQYTNFELIVQLKATEKITQNSDSSYSKAIDTSNLNYLLNSPLPAIYIFYIATTNEFLFEWAKTVYENIKKKCDDINIQDSYTVRFSKNLTIDSIRNIHSSVLKKGQEGREKFEVSVPATIKNQIWNNQGKHILDVLYDTVEYVEIAVLPYQYLHKLFPLSKTEGGGVYITDYTLYTNNEELFQFLDNITVKKNKFVFKKPTKQLSQIQNLEKKLKQVLLFLRVNLIRHIRLLDSRNQQICVHKLVLNAPLCNCEKCSFERLDFAYSLNKLKAVVKNETLAEKMRKAYVLYKFGYLKKAIESFQNLSIELKETKEYLPYFICLFNLTKLRIHISSKYFGDDRQEILNDLKSIDLTSILHDLKPKVNGFKYSILTFIEEERFIAQSLWNINDTVEKAVDLYKSDQYGGWSSNNQTEKLGFYFTWVHRFLNYNFIIYDNFSDFSKIINKSFEGFIAAHQLKNELNDKFNNFNDYLLTLIITYGDAKFLNKILIRYGVKELKLENINPQIIITITNRLYQSIDTINLVIKNDGEEKENYFFRDKINQIFSNLFLLLSRLPLSKEYFNHIFKNIIIFLPKITFVYPTCKDFLKEIIVYKGGLIDNNNFECLLKLCLTSEKWRDLNLIDRIVTKIHSNKNRAQISDKDLIDQIFTLTDEKKHTWDSLDLVIFWKIASKDFKKRIKNTILSRLKGKFNYRLYYNAVMEEIIDYQPFLDTFIKSVPKQPNENSFIEAFGGKDDGEIYRLNLLIDIAYKFDIDLKDEKYQKLHGGNPYYIWLLNLDSFQYSEFNPYWILKHQSFHYFKAFSKIPQILKATKESINNNYNEGLAKIYLYHFAK